MCVSLKFYVFFKKCFYVGTHLKFATETASVLSILSNLQFEKPLGKGFEMICDSRNCITSIMVRRTYAGVICKDSQIGVCIFRHVIYKKK